MAPHSHRAVPEGRMSDDHVEAFNTIAGLVFWALVVTAALLY